MYAEERQQAIATLVTTGGRVAVVDLADFYGVTTETVRRDLAVLDRMGLVRRVHGGAVPLDAVAGIEAGTKERELARADEKDRIARAALDHLPRPGGTVLLDAGTTTGRLAAELPADLSLTVVTNSVPIAGRLCALPNVQLHLLGGRVRGVTQAAVGDEALRVLADLRVDVAFIGTNALTAGHGLSTPDPDEAAVKRAMVRAGRRVVVLADSTKLGHEYLVRFATVDEIDLLITDSGIGTADRDELAGHNLEVVPA
ncbi:DeoR/GlpR family DNA-binding transcription regulator [Skermania piniformis]|uniref:Lactose phosphotransferase system repressor n=1 Tax=Skermania pinensis TaxID=39122 RepID=A0ABX8S3N9_9ACTN|nr:DeoR/GlpR family DNA-binding transcription regulator [Skermania piniformis]QXQ12423.1 DeoR/GlpR family DNA-binding transcription regulator [Skermania piniformis]